VLASALPIFDFVSCPPLRMEDKHMCTLMMVYVVPMMHSRLKLFLLPLGDLPDPGIKPVSPVPPALQGRFFTRSATANLLGGKYKENK